LAATGAALWWAFTRNTQDGYQRRSGALRNDERRFPPPTEFSHFEDRRFMAPDRDSRLDREHTASRVTAASPVTPSGSRMTAGLDAARLSTGVASDDERLRRASGAAPLGPTAGSLSPDCVGHPATTVSTRSAEGVGAVGDGSRLVP
jgi:hypothetical protein